MYLNKVLLFGNLTRDPELRALSSGMNVVNFSIATNRIYRDRDGKKQEQTDFHNIVVFGRQADTVNQYLKKGASAFIEGRLQTRSWEKDGQKQFRTEIIADRVQFGPRSGGPGPMGGGGGGPRRGAPAEEAESFDNSGPGASGGPAIEYPKEEINPEDIPF